MESFRKTTIRFNIILASSNRKEKRERKNTENKTSYQHVLEN